MNGHDQTNNGEQLQKLVSYIADHGVECKIEGGKLFAKNGFLRLDKPGQVWYTWEELRPTVQHVREFLGY